MTGMVANTETIENWESAVDCPIKIIVIRLREGEDVCFLSYMHGGGASRSWVESTVYIYISPF
jgi:hypothetical protein